ncbi:MAG: helix-hairpin-helix domain-containing protein [Mogibacterium sp.]|nr:helix-hairpin-helix domain-containing protein [Mogibacterium sp.]
MRRSAVNRIRSTVEDLFRDRNTIIRIGVILLILSAAVILRLHESAKASVTIEEADPVTAAEEIYVDIGGAVLRPGVYSIEAGTRLFEVIEMAGGLTDQADTSSVNQAAFVEDGEKIIIPVRRDPNEDDDSAGNDAGMSMYTYDTGQGLININTARKDELMNLTGIGDVIADRIIEYRTGSRFRSKEDIKSVKGIGDAIYDKIKDFITV